MLHNAESKLVSNSNVGMEMTVKRGPQTWAYIYVMLGFVLTIEGNIIALITPLKFPWNLIAYTVVGAATFWLFIDSGWFQNTLVKLKIKYEEKGR